VAVLARQHSGPHDPLVAGLLAEFGPTDDGGFSNRFEIF
jgi:hypothetical protein